MGAGKQGSARAAGCASSHAGTQPDPGFSLERVGSGSGTEETAEGMFSSGLRCEC